MISQEALPLEQAGHPVRHPTQWQAFNAFCHITLSYRDAHRDTQNPVKQPGASKVIGCLWSRPRVWKLAWKLINNSSNELRNPYTEPTGIIIFSSLDFSKIPDTVHSQPCCTHSSLSKQVVVSQRDQNKWMIPITLPSTDLLERCEAKTFYHCFWKKCPWHLIESKIRHSQIKCLAETV